MRPYNQETIAEAIHTKWAGKTVHFVEETDSTNLLVKRLAGEGAPHGTLAVAEFQSAGRGRLGRSWQSPTGTAVMMSLLLYPSFPPARASMLTLVMGLSVAQAVQGLGLPVSIKWPNDVVVSRKKICGILTEMELTGNQIRHVVIGVGMNVNTPGFPPEVADKATSLMLEAGHPFDRSLLPGLIMERFEENYTRFMKTCDLTLLAEEYEALLANKDQPVRVLAAAGAYDGTARGITSTGELLVETADGTVSGVNAGEVSVRGLYSYV